MRERCPGARPLYKSTLPNYKLIFTGLSARRGGGTATIQRFIDEKVMGGIYELSEKELKSLDAFEGKSYNRINVTVFTEDGEPVKAVTYIKAEQAEESKPSPEYLAIIQQGYRD